MLASVRFSCGGGLDLEVMDRKRLRLPIFLEFQKPVRVAIAYVVCYTSHPNF